MAIGKITLHNINDFKVRYFNPPECIEIYYVVNYPFLDRLELWQSELWSLEVR